MKKQLPTKKVKIFTDSPSDITVQMAEQRGISLMPATVYLDGKEIVDAVDCSKEQYIELLKNSTGIPTTSYYPMVNIQEDFEKYYNEGYTHFIIVPICSPASGLYNCVASVREEFAEKHPDLRIDLIDSMTFSYCYGRYVYQAAQMALDGVDGDEILTYLKDKLARSEAFAGMMELKYAKRSGRISGAVAFAGELLGLKPIMHIMDSQVARYGKVKGEKAVLPELIECVRKNAVDIEAQELCILYGDFTEGEVNEAESAIAEALNPKSIIRLRLGSAITSHAGPKTIAIAFEGEKKDYYS